MTHGLPAAASAALDEILDRDDDDLLGVVLSGSAARGMATGWSDVDVYVVRAEGTRAGDEILRSGAVDEVPVTLSELERPAAFGTDGWWFRWSFAWAQVLRDDTGGRVAAAVRRQATLTRDEQDAVLAARLDGYVNLVYRALKADRDGRRLERRLDAAEAVAWLLDVVFALSARVRPYNKYLAWELREHPLAVPEWSAQVLLPRLEAMLDGSPAALREVFAVVERECRSFDESRGRDVLGSTIDAWGDELGLIRGEGAGQERRALVNELLHTTTIGGVDRLVAGAVVHADEKVLVIRRSADDDFLPGIEELPSRGCDSGETIVDGLARELAEEIGWRGALEIDPNFVAHLDYRGGDGALARQYTFAVPLGDREVTLSSEHSSWRWLHLDDLDDSDMTQHSKRMVTE